jgi:hypothetical protein
MPFLKEIINKVNQSLKTNAINDIRFASGRIENIARSIGRYNSENQLQVFPVVLTDSFDFKDISIDDTFPLIVYHKILSNSYTQQTSDRNYQSKTDVKMVVYGKVGRINLTPEQLEAVFSMNFPTILDKSGTNLDSIYIRLLSSEMDGQKVFNEEYSNIDYRLSENDILISFRYSIESAFRKGCFNICDCGEAPTPPPPPSCINETFGYQAACGTVATPPENWESFTFDLSNARTGNVLQFVDLENENLYIDFGIQINIGAIGLRSFEDVGTVFTSFVTDATITCWASFDLSSLEIQTGTFSGGNADEMTITNFSGILAPSLINVDITCYEIEVASFDAIAGQLDNYGLQNGTLSVLTVVPMVGFDINIVNSLIGKGWTVNYSL